ncbi:MAG: DUF3489 domain-containing protein [Sphingopyxis sp.]|uniref:DUF3489 domain-containing protein n=1 Tax=Sphingopyxis sp. TaxID=1908224 RepID=UPI003D6D39B9
MTDTELKPPVAPSKASIVEQLLAKAAGASIAEIGAATGWQPHSCRAFLTSLKKKGRVIERSKRKDGTTIYRIIKPGKSKVVVASPDTATVPATAGAS